MNGQCPVCGQEHCRLKEADTIRPSRAFHQAFPLGGWWHEVAAAFMGFGLIFGGWLAVPYVAVWLAGGPR